MKIAAVKQAAERLDRCRDALGRMETASAFSEFEKPWSDFLLAASGIYSKLEQGGKGLPKSQRW